MLNQRLHLVGDSIRIQYDVYVTPSFKSTGNIHDVNNESSLNIVNNLQAWVLNYYFQILHLNCGIHDQQDGTTDADYKTNLRTIINAVVASRDYVKIILATTTPLGDPVKDARVTQLNVLMLEVAAEYDSDVVIGIDDLNACVRAISTWPNPWDEGLTHFTEESAALIGAYAADRISTLMEPYAEDVFTMAITVGTGGGYNYTTLAAALTSLTDIATGAIVEVNIETDLTETIIASKSMVINGTLIINGKNHLITNEANNTLIAIGPTATSAGIITIKNLYIIGTGELSATRNMLGLYGAADFTGIYNVFNCRFNGNSKRFTGLAFNCTASTVNVYRCIFKNCSDGTNTSSGIQFVTNFPVAAIVENCVFDGCYRQVSNANKAYTYNSCQFWNRASASIYQNTGSVSNNCATDAAAVGAATDNSPKVSEDESVELVNTDIADLTDGYKCLTAQDIFNDGLAPTIADNTTDIYGKIAVAPYEIGVARQRLVPTITSITPNTGAAAGGTAIAIAGINQLIDGSTHAVVTVGGNAATGEASTIAKTDCETPSGTAGAVDVVLTNSDGESATLADGFTFESGAVKYFPLGTGIGIGTMSQYYMENNNG